jgi:AraC-like DNA-binding protein
MDALSDALRIMRLRGGVFMQGQFVDPWCISVKVLPASCSPYLGDTAHVIPYHFVVEGHLRVRMEDGLEFELGPGDSVMFPRNDLHLLGSDVSRPPVPSRDIVEHPVEGGLDSIILGEGRPRTRIVCGFLGAEEVHRNPVVDALPAVLRLNVRDHSSAEWIQSTFQYAAERIAAGRLGSEVVMSKLSELLFIEAIQHYTESLTGEEVGWLAGLKDRFVSRAMTLLHARISESWTLDDLARDVGLSRTALAARFCQVLGVPPMRYLTNWRIHVAAYELINSSKSISQIAPEVGYRHEASFTRAFTRMMGMPPAAWRRQHK